MFRLSDSTRRKITLGLFFAFCVVPTIGVLAFVAWHNRPGHVQAEADRLGRLLGGKVTLEDVEHPRPNITVYRELTISDPESGKPLFDCGRLEAASRLVEDQQGRRKPCLMLSASRARTNADELRQSRRLLDRLLSGGTAWSGIDLEIAVKGELALFTEPDLATHGSPFALTDVRGHVVTNAEGVLAEIRFRPLDLEMPDPIWISLQRNRQTDPPETRLRVNTGTSLLPTYFLALGLEQFDRLGPKCQFGGVIDSYQTVKGSSGNVSGSFRDLDFESVLRDRFVHRLDGTARLEVEKARFSEGRLLDASGWLMSGPGSVSRSLLNAAQQNLGLPTGGPADPRLDPIPYDLLAVSFSIDSAGLKLEGRCGTEAGNAIMTDSTGPVLGPSLISSHPIASVIAALSPNEPAQVSATQQTARLMSRLPLPDGRQPVNR
jgi:hypothetical protein